MMGPGKRRAHLVPSRYGVLLILLVSVMMVGSFWQKKELPMSSVENSKLPVQRKLEDTSHLLDMEFQMQTRHTADTSLLVELLHTWLFKSFIHFLDLSGYNNERHHALAEVLVNPLYSRLGDGKLTLGVGVALSFLETNSSAILDIPLSNLLQIQRLVSNQNDGLREFLTENYSTELGPVVLDISMFLVDTEGPPEPITKQTTGDELIDTFSPSVAPVENEATESPIGNSTLENREPTETPTTSASPSTWPSVLPSFNPSTVPPSLSPSIKPTNSPQPSRLPSTVPSLAPSISNQPTSSQAPSQRPSSLPSAQPTVSVFPSAAPSLEPSDTPSQIPTSIPSAPPTISRPPSAVPSILPSTMPSLSMAPSTRPSVSMMPSMSLAPSSTPSLEPSNTYEPSPLPSAFPSILPTDTPSVSPSLLPSPVPTIYADVNFTQSIVMKLSGLDRQLTNLQIRSWLRETSSFVQDFWNDDDSHPFSPVHVVSVDTRFTRQVYDGEDGTADEDLFSESQVQTATGGILDIYYSQTIGIGYNDGIPVGPGLGNLNETLFLFPFRQDSFTYTQTLMEIVTNNSQQIYWVDSMIAEEMPKSSDNDRTLIILVVCLTASVLLTALGYIVYKLRKEGQEATRAAQMDSSVAPVPVIDPVLGKVEGGESTPIVRKMPSKEYPTHVRSSSSPGGFPVIQPVHYRTSSGEYSPIRPMVGHHQRDNSESGSAGIESLSGMLIQPSTPASSLHYDGDDIVSASPSSIGGGAGMSTLLSETRDGTSSYGEDSSYMEDEDDEQVIPHMSGFQMQVQDLDD